MSVAGAAVWRALVSDTVDSSASNPSLLTLANQTPARIASGHTIAATTLALLAPAGSLSATLTAAGPLQPGDSVWIADPVAPEAAVVAPAGVAGNVVTFTAPLAAHHDAGTPLNALPSIITTSEPREPILTTDQYWRIVVGPTVGHPHPQFTQRAPTRYYEAVMLVKTYDQSPSRALVEAVQLRLDYLLNLGEAGCNGNPASLFGAGGGVTIDACKLVLTPAPTYNADARVAQYLMEYHLLYRQRFL